MELALNAPFLRGKKGLKETPKRWTCNLPLVYCIGFYRQDFAFLCFSLLFGDCCTPKAEGWPSMSPISPFALTCWGSVCRRLPLSWTNPSLKRSIHRSRGTIQSRDLPILQNWCTNVPPKFIIIVSCRMAISGAPFLDRSRPRFFQAEHISPAVKTPLWQQPQLQLPAWSHVETGAWLPRFAANPILETSRSNEFNEITENHWKSIIFPMGRSLRPPSWDNAPFVVLHASEVASLPPGFKLWSTQGPKDYSRHLLDRWILAILAPENSIKFIIFFLQIGFWSSMKIIYPLVI